MSKYIDLSKWPLVMVTWKPGFKTQDIEEVISILKAQSGRNEPWGIVADFTQIPPMEKEQLNLFAAFTDDYRDQLRRYLKGLAFAMNSPVMRLAINGYSLLARNPSPVRSFSSVDEALKWVYSHLNAGNPEKYG